jgi:hypothetical protein
MFGFILFFFSSFPTQPVFIYLFLFDHLDRHEYIFPFILEAIISHRLTTTSSMSPSERVKNQKRGRGGTEDPAAAA